MQSIILATLLALPAVLFAATCPAGNGNYNAANQANILDYHNMQLRSPIAFGRFIAKGQRMPPAMNMRKMFWECGLEKSAQAWANGCQFKHSNGNYGENLYMTYTSLNSPALPIDGSGLAASKSWANEFQQYGWPSLNLTLNNFNSGIGHATQMAWWSSNNIGCGAQQCRDSSKQFVLVVCQYSPSGNYLNQNNYTPGNTCGLCGSGFYCEQKTGLCLPLQQ